MGPDYTTTIRNTAATGRRTTSADELRAAGDLVRRRAEALLPGRLPAGGHGLAAAVDPPLLPPARGALTSPGHLPRPGGRAGAGEQVRRAREALCERLPVWVRLRCGLEPRTLLALGAVLAAAGALAVHHFVAGQPRTVTAPAAASPGPLAAAARSRPGPASAADDSVPPGAPGGDTDLPDPADDAPGGAPLPGGPGAGLPGRGLRPPLGVVVDVAGKVRSPGVLRLPAGARVADAVKAAGGALPGADTSSLNLARLLTDGEQVMVGRPQQPAVPAPAAAGAATPVGEVSLNGASPEQLDTLPGVGPVLARHIVEWRLRHGGFTSVGQLREVSGVGDRRYDELRALVRP